MAATINTVVLKIASRCNINCTYCYEYNRGDSSWLSKPKRLSTADAHLLAVRISEYSQIHGLKAFNISLHGGEPTIIGAPALEEIMNEIRDNSRVEIRFGMQTNGTLINDQMIDVLKRNNVRVAVSLDGGAEENSFRLDHKGRQTRQKAVAGLGKIKDAGLFSGIQAVINLSSDPRHVLEDLASFNPPEIELGQPFGTHDNRPELPADGSGLGRWLLDAFNFWVTSKELRKTKVIILHEALTAVLTDRPNSEWFPNRPPGYIVVSTDGTYEGLDTLKVAGQNGRVLGLNLREHSISQALDHPNIRERERLSVVRPSACQSCSILDWCNGGYYPTRFSVANGFDNKSIYCEDWKEFFFGLGKWVLDNHVDMDRRETLLSRLNELGFEETKHV